MPLTHHRAPIINLPQKNSIFWMQKRRMMTTCNESAPWTPPRMCSHCFTFVVFVWWHCVHLSVRCEVNLLNTNIWWKTWMSSYQSLSCLIITYFHIVLRRWVVMSYISVHFHNYFKCFIFYFILNDFATFWPFSINFILFTPFLEFCNCWSMFTITLIISDICYAF